MSTSKGDKLFIDAEKKSSKFDWFGISREKNMEDAAELYAKAAAQFKISKEYDRAGEAYEKAAECNMAAGNDIEANTNWREAGKCWRHADGDRSIKAFQHATQYYLDNDKFSQAAKVVEEVGDILGEDEKYEEAIKSYEQAASYYETENDKNSAIKRLLQVAHLGPKVKQYEKSIDIFVKAATFSADNNLLRWSVKTYLFQAMLCQIANASELDIQMWKKVQQAFEQYRIMSDLFSSSRECALIEKLLKDIADLNLDAYQAHVSEFASISPLDAWCNSLILQGENYIREKQHEDPDLLGNDGFDNEQNQPQVNQEAPQIDPFQAPKNDVVYDDAPDLL